LGKVVAHEVYDHDVLGDVLLCQVDPGSAGSLDRRGPHPIASTAQIQLRRGRRNVKTHVRQTDQALVRSRVCVGEPAGQRKKIWTSADRRGQHAAQVDLVDGSCGDALADLLDAVHVPATVDGARPALG
jgi:hypothetical protein